MDNIVRYKGIIRDLTGVELCLHMCKLLVSDGAVTQHKAAGHGIKIVTEGMTVKGVPVGTDDNCRLHSCRPGQAHQEPSTRP